MFLSKEKKLFYFDPRNTFLILKFNTQSISAVKISKTFFLLISSQSIREKLINLQKNRAKLGCVLFYFAKGYLALLEFCVPSKTGIWQPKWKNSLLIHLSIKISLVSRGGDRFTKSRKKQLYSAYLVLITVS